MLVQVTLVKPSRSYTKGLKNRNGACQKEEGIHYGGAMNKGNGYKMTKIHYISM